jgi:DNA-directed RNA polymerase III subunit RPC2
MNGNIFDSMYDEKELNKPLKKVEDKWKLVPAFLRLRGLVKQHIDSFNYFINVDMKKMVAANNIITSDNPQFRDYYVKFTDIYVGMPTMEEDRFLHNLTPNECRIRDLTYSAPIFVDLEYTKGDKIFRTKKVNIG